eukprot:TRINITY_DN3972_c1_g1_i1.p1 TRINITY_DN3972_c1_g1~~TRINITY_DN3972_c1_g1_i1.p1  ORF type:complete len:633 (+),score=56.79 TRINITY_DN3972_c1_g1_i1:1146-3044(+)
MGSFNRTVEPLPFDIDNIVRGAKGTGISANDQSPITIRTAEIGVPGSLSFRTLFVNQQSVLISPWHDVPLFGPDASISCICKTPAGSDICQELSFDEPYDPFRVKRQAGGVSRSVQGSPDSFALFPRTSSDRLEICRPSRLEQQASSLSSSSSISTVERWETNSVETSPSSTSEFAKEAGGSRGGSDGSMQSSDFLLSPFGSVDNSRKRVIEPTMRPVRYLERAPWNVGMCPQTYATAISSGKPNVLSQSPLEVIEVGFSKLRKLGEIYQVQPLGAFRSDAEEGSLESWTLLAIARDDPMAGELEEEGSLQRSLPGLVEQVQDWLQTRFAPERGLSESFVGAPLPPIPQLWTPFASMELATSKVAEGHCVWSLHRQQLQVVDSDELRLPSLDPAEVERVWSLCIGVDLSTLGKTAPPPEVPVDDAPLLWDESWFCPTQVEPLPSATVAKRALANDRTGNGRRQHQRSPSDVKAQWLNEEDRSGGGKMERVSRLSRAKVELLKLWQAPPGAGDTAGKGTKGLTRSASEHEMSRTKGRGYATVRGHSGRGGSQGSAEGLSPLGRRMSSLFEGHPEVAIDDHAILLRSVSTRGQSARELVKSTSLWTTPVASPEMLGQRGGVTRDLRKGLFHEAH